ncbi:MAG: SPOR domain-containing protein [Epsilonproteobacteria bacterium]|nr:SPOR domain-containing protein [Campylobacterota bacterium]
MEDKNELSDIVLEKGTSKTLKAKRILIIAAILIIIFLAVILSMKFINKTQTVQEPKIVLPPQPISTVQKATKDEQLFKQVPIIEEKTTKKDSFENMVKSLKEKEIQKTKILQAKTKQEVKKGVVIAPKIIQNVVKPLVKTTKKEIKKVVPKGTTKGIYVQVGATSRYAPNKKYLKKITDKKYSYALLPITIKGKKITKILIGPFKSNKLAKKNMINIKKDINKNAFIYRVK